MLINFPIYICMYTNKSYNSVLSPRDVVAAVSWYASGENKVGVKVHCSTPITRVSILLSWKP